MIPVGVGAAEADPGSTPAADRKALTHHGFESARDSAERLIGSSADALDFVEFDVDDDVEVQPDTYTVRAVGGRIRIAATTAATAVAGLNAYLGTIGQSVSWNVRNVEPGGELPLPEETITSTANVTHRFYGNDTEDGYTGAYRSWEQWEAEIDELAALGFNEVFMPVGSEAVYYEVFQEFGYTAEEMRAWIPLPAHQPWWLLQNMSGYPSGISEHVLEERAALGRKIADRLRELDMVPVLPGYFGTVPSAFAERNADARIEPQGGWVGFTRPDWLDPNSGVFSALADSFYSTSEELLGASTMYKMDVLHEGGRRGSVDVPAATRAIESALQSAHPGALWVFLGWQNNPPKDVAAAVNPETTFIVDGLSDRYDGRGGLEEQWSGVPYAFGTIWNFGGHSTIGAELSTWNERYWAWRDQEGSAVDGIAAMPEGGLNNPAAIDFFAGLAWRDGPVDVGAWFDDWTFRRYGVADDDAKAAWRVIAETAYTLPKNSGYSEAHDGLFGAAPSLTKTTAASWSPGSAAYDLAEFAVALEHLVAASDRIDNAAFRYDLMDVSRQVVSNTSRTLLPQVRRAYQSRDLAKFDALTTEWLSNIDLLDEIVGTQPQNLLGRWIADARAMAGNDAEADALEYDARSVITTWGEASAVQAGLNDYANREFQGLVGTYYKGRWSHYFDSLRAALVKGGNPVAINWHTVGAAFTTSTDVGDFATEPSGDIEALAAEALVRHVDAEVPIPAPPAVGTHFLSDLEFSAETIPGGYGPIERDREVGQAGAGDGGPLRIAGVQYAKGLGVQAPMSVSFNLGAKCSVFAAVVGIDDIMVKPNAYPNVIFRVVGDGTKLFDSGAMAGGVSKPLSVDVTGVSTLTLEVDANAAASLPGHGAEWWDRADWADAKVTCG
ncbi:hypothetical protein GCM10009747_22900 [Agromyces humatus]|uniref:Glycosyl hydrolase family 98 putative carbohydrate-binding module domain-containing protein n=1 Tax=Agromyces humatus TaxID=279573 RepID=A0ABP4WTY1_9MICO